MSKVIGFGRAERHIGWGMSLGGGGLGEVKCLGVDMEASGMEVQISLEVCWGAGVLEALENMWKERPLSGRYRGLREVVRMQGTPCR